MRRTERTKDTERNISKGGVGNDTFDRINSSNIHVGCKIIETKNSNLFHVMSAVFFFLLSPPVVVCISLPLTYQRPNLC